MTTDRPISCPDCDGEFEFTRRDFVKTVGAGAVAAGVTPLLASVATAAPTSKSKGESIVKKFYESLSADQKKEVCFPFGHKLQTKLNANWHVTPKKIGDDFYSDAQRDLIDRIVKAVTSEDGYDRIKLQMKDDRPKGFHDYAVAIFGTPGGGKFEWEMTGRHLTMRCDGDSVENMAFGGPIVYGHGVSNPKKNLFHYQTKQTNEVFKSLEGKQRKAALLDKAPSESSVPLQGKAGKFPGIAISELTSDQQELVKKTLKTILAPYRKEDVDEAMDVLQKGGGVKTLHMAFYKQGDLDKDKVWDIWRVEGPTFVWHFRGAPHVHAYINIGLKKA
jgi:Protein of unknown function (DUF3500)